MLGFEVSLPDLWINLAELLFERNTSGKKKEGIEVVR